jgi:hypothetical protein
MLTCGLGGGEEDNVGSLLGFHFFLSHGPSMSNSDADKRMMV